MAGVWKINWDEFPYFRLNDNSVLEILQDILNDIDKIGYGQEYLGIADGKYHDYITGIKIVDNKIYNINHHANTLNDINYLINISENAPVFSSQYGTCIPVSNENVFNLNPSNFEISNFYYELNDNDGYNSRFSAYTISDDFKNKYFLSSWGDVRGYLNSAEWFINSTETYSPMNEVPRSLIDRIRVEGNFAMVCQCDYYGYYNGEITVQDKVEVVINPLALLATAINYTGITDNYNHIIDRYNYSPYKMIAILPDDDLTIANTAMLDYGVQSQTHYCTLIAVEKEYLYRLYNLFNQPFTVNDRENAINTPVEDLPNYEPIDHDSQPLDDSTGEYNSFSDEIDFPDLPSINVFDSGMFKAYKLNDELMIQLAGYLWSANFFEVLSRLLFKDPAETIIMLSTVPLNPQSLSTENIKFGSLESEIQAPVIDNQFQIFDFGSININHYFGTYADYEGYSDIQIYLPFLGMKTININDVMNSTISLKYYIDLYSGDTIAYIKVNNMNINSVIYSFTGNILNHLPISSTNYSNLIINGMKTLYLMGSNPAVGALSALNSNMTISPKIESSYTNGGVLSITKPYIILRRQIIKKNNNQPLYDNSTQTGLQTGLNIFDRILNIDTSNMTDSEYDEIEKLLKNGVIYK